MKKIGLCLLLLVVLGVSFGFAYDNPELIKVGSPVLITSFGQNQDSNFVKLLGQKLKLKQTYLTAVESKDVDWSQYKAMICVIGGSQKGLGQAGLDIPSELARCNQLMADARANGVKVIGMHIGGEDRRGPNSEPFLFYAGEVDYMIVKSNGNQDGYFTKLCAEKGVPMYTIDTTSEITNVLKTMFF